MQDPPSQTIPAQYRDAACEALLQVLGSAPAERIEPVYGSSTGAGLFRIDGAGARFLLRIEGPETAMLKRNPHRFTCMTMAADAGLAPLVHYVDETQGLTVTDFIAHKPLQSFPGGAPALVRALGECFRDLQNGPAFPPLVDYRDLVRDMLEHLGSSGLFAPGLLDPHIEALAQLRADIPWDSAALVASHNDPNPNNILFDGERLWLIDWETAYRNHPCIDLAIVSETFAPSPELMDALLEAWLGRPPGAESRQTLQMVRRLTRLYYACFLLQAGGAKLQRPVTDISVLSSGDILHALKDGRLTKGGAETVFAFGKLYLDGFLTGTLAPGLREAGAAAF